VCDTQGNVHTSCYHVHDTDGNVHTDLAVVCLILKVMYTQILLSCAYRSCYHVCDTQGNVHRDLGVMYVILKIIFSVCHPEVF
jgi:hypothetical protein